MTKYSILSVCFFILFYFFYILLTCKEEKEGGAKPFCVKMKNVSNALSTEKPSSQQEIYGGHSGKPGKKGENLSFILLKLILA